MSPGLQIQFCFHLNIAHIAQYYLYTVEHNYAIALRLKQLMSGVLSFFEKILFSLLFIRKNISSIDI